MKRILLILSLCVCLVLVSCSNDYDVSSNNADDSQQSNDYDTTELRNLEKSSSFDVTRFANISGKQLISILGEPSSVDDGYGKGFCDIPAVYYNYENDKTFGNVIFVLVNNSVVRMTSNHFYSYDSDYFNSVEDTLKHFGIKMSDNCETVVENEIARRYRCPSSNIDDVFFGPSFGVKDGFGQLEVTYDMSYYEEWYLPTAYDEFAQYNPHSKEFIKQFLNYPNTAKFSALNYEDKSNDYYFWISSTVEAKNAFGVASEYAYNVIYDRATSNVVYADLGGEVIFNDGYEDTYNIIKSKFSQTLHKEALNSTSVVANIMENPFQDDYTEDYTNDYVSNNEYSDNSYNGNDESLLFDALAEYCNKYNDEGGRLFEEVISWRIVTPTDVELYLSTEYSLTDSQLTEFDTLASAVLDEIVSFVDNNYYFPEIITFNLTMEYYEADNDSDEYYYDDSSDDWSYEDDWYYEDETDYEETDSNTTEDDDAWELPPGNDMDVLRAALDEFCNGYHSCEYDCSLEATIVDKRSVDIHHNIEALIPIADSQKIGAIDKQIGKDIEAFVLGYADFPEGLSFRVIPGYWYDTES